MTQAKPRVVDFTRPDESSSFFPKAPVLSSHGKGWQDLVFEEHRQPPHDTDIHSLATHSIAVTKTTGLVERWLDGKFIRKPIFSGCTVIIPAHIEHRSQWLDSTTAHFSIIAFDAGLWKQADPDLIEASKVELIPQWGQEQDPLLQGIAIALEEELISSGIGITPYVEQLTTTLSMHVLKKYTTRPVTVREYEDGLSRYQLKQAIAYIHAHLDQHIKLADIAKLLGMSQYYFCRQFRDSMGIPPYQYVIKQRVERAKQLLRKDQQRAIADIALDCGFNSTSHLAKHFRQLTGTTAKAYRARM